MTPSSWSLEQLGEPSNRGASNRPPSAESDDASPDGGAAGENRGSSDLLRKAKEKIEALEDRVEQERREGYREGYEEGRREARTELADDVESAVDALGSAAGSLETEHRGWEDAVRDNLCALAVAVARQILDRQIEQDPSLVEERVDDALNRFPIDEPVTVRLHPKDLSVIRDLGGEGRDLELGSGRDVEWRADGELDRGSCVLEGPDHIVDGRTDRALLRVYKEISHG